MKKITINIAKDFSKYPGPRYIVEGDFSGELFRRDFLAPAIKKAIQNNESVEVVLDGTSGFGTSFIEEVFGGLIREDKILYEEIKKRVHIISNEEDYLLDDIKQYLLQAKKQH